MRKLALQRMETYDLVKYASQTPCYICDGDNCFDKAFCRHCGAPLALALQSEGQKKPPHMIAVVGTPGAGKTAYLGMLTDILSRQHGSLQILARGAFSVSLQQNSICALAAHRFPDQTPQNPEGWNWVHCEVRGLPKKRNVDVVLPDVSGESFLAELEHPSSIRIIREFLKKCSAAMLLVDTDRLERGDQGPDFTAMKIVSYLSELAPDRKKGWAKRPVAVVFTKADRSSSCFDDPEHYGRQTTPGLWRQCQERLERHRVFATTLVGASVEVRSQGETVTLPLRVEPRGVAQPFEWLVDQLSP